MRGRARRGYGRPSKGRCHDRGDQRHLGPRPRRGLGVDEDTAVVVTGNCFEVIGSGTVTVVDAGTVTCVRTPPPGDDSPIALTGATLHVLPSGYAFELLTRTPVITSAPEDAVALHEGQRR